MANEKTELEGWKRARKDLKSIQTRLKLRQVEFTFLVVAAFFAVFGFLACVVWASQEGFEFRSVLSAGSAVGAAACLFGCLVGFLFGIPRTLASKTPEPQSQVHEPGKPNAVAEPGSQNPTSANTNLEQISDWLTKILVGAGLTQLAQIGPGISALHRALKPVLGNTAASGGFGVAIVLYSAIGGFLAAYVWTRLKLSPAFETTGALSMQSDIKEALEALTQLEHLEKADEEHRAGKTGRRDDARDPREAPVLASATPRK